MKHIEARIKTSFGEVTIEGETPQEILDMLNNIPENFVEKLSDFVANRLTPSGAQLKGIIEPTTEGPCHSNTRKPHPLRSSRTSALRFHRKKKHRCTSHQAARIQRNKKHGACTIKRND